jgi:single-stranded DNA-specific DHH superfamily exonuclease
MGKTTGQQCTAAPSRQQPEEIIELAMSDKQIFENLEFVENGPDWRVVNPFREIEAQQLIREIKEIDLDPAVAAKLLDLDYDGDFSNYKSWYFGRRSLIKSPEQTCPGMSDAASLLVDAIEAEEKIAVYCDYDLDGTSAGEAFRRGLAPYGADLHYGWANAQQGFGLTNEFVEEAAQAGAKVLVTLDCGSTQTDQVALAQSLGMKVIVVDHHHAVENPADFHLNPKIYDPPTSSNTGAQLAWKLAAAVQIAAEGSSREEHGLEALNLAGMGCLADMGSAALPENRAFFWGSHQHPIPGVEVIAEQLGEDPQRPGSMVMTQAVLNLPKRTAKVEAADVGRLLAAESREEAEPIAAKLLEAYKEAQPAKRQMTDQGLEQVGSADWDRGRPTRPEPEQRVGKVVINKKSDYAGYSGVVANSIASKAYKPVAVFVNKGEDDQGQKLYKFSMRNAGTQREVKIGALIEDEQMRAACQIKKRNEAGELVEEPSLGGHADVVSGTCTKSNLKSVQKAIDEWADSIADTKYWKEPSRRSEYLTERRVSADRLSAIEQQAAQLGPFGMGPQETEEPKAGREAKTSYHMPLKISMIGVLGEMADDPDNPNFKASTLTFSNGDTREVRFPAELDAPVGKMCEWILKVAGGSGPYYLRQFHDPTS